MLVHSCALIPGSHRSSAVRGERPFPAGLRLLILTVLLHHPLPPLKNPPMTETSSRSVPIFCSFLSGLRIRKELRVEGLTTNDLNLKDDDQVTSGLNFTPGADRVALMFALDQSGSLREVIHNNKKLRSVYSNDLVIDRPLQFCALRKRRCSPYHFSET